MPVKVKCKGCSAVLNAPDRARGKAIKCPKCGKGVRVPAESTSRPKRRPVRQAVAEDDDDFLGGMDLGHFEDRTARVCPKCGAIAGDEDIDCPSCGADLATGGLGKLQRARAKRKGAAPSEYYSKAFSDAGAYLMKKLGLVGKSFLMLSIFPILTITCLDFIIWCHNWPPELFWLFVATICFLITPGWFWYVQNQFILRILEPKRDKYPVRFEPFSAVSLGIKAVAWSAFFGLPFWIIFGGVAGLLAMMGSSLGATIVFSMGAALFMLIALISWPIAQAHFAMPLTSPGWMIHKVLPDVARNIGPALYAAAVAFGLFLPVAGIIAGAYLVAAPKHEKLQDALAEHSNVNWANEAIAIAEENTEEPPPEAKEIADNEPAEIDWSLLLWPMVAIVPVSLAFSIWMIFVSRMTAQFVKLFRANIENLLTHEKDYVYTSLSPHEKEKLEEERGPLTENAVKSYALIGVVFAALGGVGLAMSVGKSFGFVASFGFAFFVVGSLLNLVALMLITRKAWRTSPLWGLALMVPFFDIVPFFLFVAKEYKRVIYDFQLWLFSMAFFFVAGIAAAIYFGMAIYAAASEAAKKAEEAEQALRLIGTAITYLC